MAAMTRFPVVLLLALLLFVPGLPGCGRGGGDGGMEETFGLPTGPGDGSGDEGGGPNPPTATIPDVVLIGIGGHAPVGQAATYLETTFLPWLAGELVQAGYTVETHGFIDAASGAQGFGDLTARLATVRDTYIVGKASPTRVVMLAHSHGGVWAHAATRDVPDCPIRCFVDLDTNSYGWSLAHTPDNAVLGGSPDNAYVIGVNVNPPAFPAITSEPGFLYDLEDVIFPSVRDALEVVTADLVPVLTGVPGLQRYDTRWNARPDGTTTGITPLYVPVLHGEPVLTPTQGGTTSVTVRDWILARLLTP